MPVWKVLTVVFLSIKVLPNTKFYQCYLKYLLFCHLKHTSVLSDTVLSVCTSVHLHISKQILLHFKERDCCVERDAALILNIKFTCSSESCSSFSCA